MAKKEYEKGENNLGCNFHYFAFISYKREDEKWARWLHRKLEGYRLPISVGKDRPELPKGIKPIFRDTTDIKPGVLADVLTQNLEQSKYLIVICSPRSAHSQWVGKEISEFIAQGKQNNIILLIVDGIPYSSDPSKECYHPVIKEKLPEMLGVNVHEVGEGSAFIKKQRAFIQIVSNLLDVTFDSLWQRQKRRIILHLVLAILSIVFFASAISAAAYYQHNVNQPFDVHIRLHEMSYHNASLPVRNGHVLLYYGRDTSQSAPIQDLGADVVFKDIPGKHLNTKAFVGFRMEGYYPLDTLLLLEKSLVIPIHRNQRYGLVKGQIIDDQGSGLPSVKITIGRQFTQSDSNGQFYLYIPDTLQTISKPTVVEKQGYKTIHGNFAVGNSWSILLQKQ
jgi:hypothetical protein